eukprot:TRINITY_DN27811_c0_g1_i1.p1 TRINITY_DN27811_c0_g1~~TRINITY_DN27811_c0_g1_i1.p1  ORF type:complete len:521 (+),score=135.71 TRINITY_DN27811_c0_g1_i1:153-1715(+)
MDGRDSATLQDFEWNDFLGLGSFCEVLRCKDQRSGLQYAGKRVAKKQKGADQACLMEEHCLRRLEPSPWVVTMLCAFDSATHWTCILEWCSGGELWEEVKDCGCLSQAEARRFATQMVQALAAVHAAEIVHRDVKCENFLITASPDRSLKLIDFGTARDCAHPEVPTMLLGPGYEHHVGTPNFMAPEAIIGAANDRRSDLWSLGCTIAQLLVGTPPFGAGTPFLVMTKAQAGSPPWLPERGLAEEAKDLVRCLVQMPPEKRLGAQCSTEKVLDHPFLHGAVASSAGCNSRPLDAALKLIARASLREVAAVLAAEELAAAQASWGDLPQSAGKEAVASALQADDQPGKATEGLLVALPEVLGDAGLPGEQLLAAVRRAATETNTAAEPESLAPRVAQALAEEIVAFDLASKGGEDAALLVEAMELVQRFAELAHQRLHENKEVPDFGSNDDEGSGTESEKEHGQLEDSVEVEAEGGTSVDPEENVASAAASGSSAKKTDAEVQQKKKEEMGSQPKQCCMLL